MPSSPVEICNGAIIKIGATPIMTMDDESNQGRACKLRYHTCRKALLRLHPWNFATKRITLAASTTPPAYGAGFMFPLPADFIRIVTLDKYDDAKWRIEGKNLVVENVLIQNSAVLNVRYVYDVTDVSQFDTLFVEAFEYFLGADICYRVTQSLQLKQELVKELADCIRRAKLPDSQERSKETVQADEFLLARVSSVLGGMGGNGWTWPAFDYPEGATSDIPTPYCPPTPAPPSPPIPPTPPTPPVTTPTADGGWTADSGIII